MSGPDGYLISKYNDMSGSYTCRRLIAEGAARGMDLRALGVRDTALTAAGPQSKGEVPCRRGFAILRYKWGKIPAQLSRLADRSYNEAEAFFRFVNKYEQLRLLRSPRFEIPEYLLTAGAPCLEETEEALGLPFVAKGLDRSMGEDIFLIEKEEDLLALRAFGPEKEWLCERFIAGSRGRDMRVFAIRGEAVAVMERSSDDDFRANVALGAKTRALDITDWMKGAAADIYAQTGLDVVGIDFLYGEEKPYLCEINVMPGLEGIEQTTGENLAGRIMQMIREDFEG